MLETKCVGDNFKMLVTVLAIFDHQHPLSLNIRGGHQDPNVTNMTVTALGLLGSVNYAGLSVPGILILRFQDIYNQNI